MHLRTQSLCGATQVLIWFAILYCFSCLHSANHDKLLSGLKRSNPAPQA